MAAVKSAMRRALIVAAVLLAPLSVAPPAAAQVSIEIAIPGVRIGIVQPFYPDLVLVPGYPVYYAPQARVNYFFYDGFYWVFQDERWYRSAWYDGPWDRIDPYYVPLFVLRVPVRYYINPPVYFHGWVVTAPPRWDLYWGPRWAEHHRGWDHWDHRAVPRAAPPPVYQRHYSGDRYPRREHQNELREQHYRYQPREATLRRQPPERPVSNAPAQQQTPSAPERREAPRSQYPQQDGREVRGREVRDREMRDREVRGRETRGDEMRSHEVPRYAPGPQGIQAAPREPVVQEPFRPLVRADDRRAPSAAVAAPPVTHAPVMQNPREEWQRPAPAQSSPQRAPQAFEQRPAARQDNGPRESPQLRAPPGRERESQGRVEGQLRVPQDRGR